MASTPTVYRKSDLAALVQAKDQEIFDLKAKLEASERGKAKLRDHLQVIRQRQLEARDLLGAHSQLQEEVKTLAAELQQQKPAREEAERKAQELQGHLDSIAASVGLKQQGARPGASAGKEAGTVTQAISSSLGPEALAEAVARLSVDLASAQQARSVAEQQLLQAQAKAAAAAGKVSTSAQAQEGTSSKQVQRLQKQLQEAEAARQQAEAKAEAARRAMKGVEAQMQLLCGQQQQLQAQFKEQQAVNAQLRAQLMRHGSSLAKLELGWAALRQSAASPAAAAGMVGGGGGAAAALALPSTSQTAEHGPSAPAAGPAQPELGILPAATVEGNTEAGAVVACPAAALPDAAAATDAYVAQQQQQLQQQQQQQHRIEQLSQQLAQLQEHTGSMAAELRTWRTAFGGLQRSLALLNGIAPALHELSDNLDAAGVAAAIPGGGARLSGPRAGTHATSAGRRCATTAGALGGAQGGFGGTGEAGRWCAALPAGGSTAAGPVAQAAAADSVSDLFAPSTDENEHDGEAPWAAAAQRPAQGQALQPFLVRGPAAEEIRAAQRQQKNTSNESEQAPLAGLPGFGTADALVRFESPPPTKRRKQAASAGGAAMAAVAASRPAPARAAALLPAWMERPGGGGTTRVTDADAGSDSSSDDEAGPQMPASRRTGGGKKNGRPAKPVDPNDLMAPFVSGQRALAPRSMAAAGRKLGEALLSGRCSLREAVAALQSALLSCAQPAEGGRAAEALAAAVHGAKLADVWMVCWCAPAALQRKVLPALIEVATLAEQQALAAGSAEPASGRERGGLLVQLVASLQGFLERHLSGQDESAAGSEEEEEEEGEIPGAPASASQLCAAAAAAAGILSTQSGRPARRGLLQLLSTVLYSAGGPQAGSDAWRGGGPVVQVLLAAAAAWPQALPQIAAASLDRAVALNPLGCSIVAAVHACASSASGCTFDLPAAAAAQKLLQLLNYHRLWPADDALPAAAAQGIWAAVDTVAAHLLGLVQAACTSAPATSAAIALASFQTAGSAPRGELGRALVLLCRLRGVAWTYAQVLSRLLSWVPDAAEAQQLPLLMELVGIVCAAVFDEDTGAGSAAASRAARSLCRPLAALLQGAGTPAAAPPLEVQAQAASALTRCLLASSMLGEVAESDEDTSAAEQQKRDASSALQAWVAGVGAASLQQLLSAEVLSMLAKLEELMQ